MNTVIAAYPSYEMFLPYRGQKCKLYIKIYDVKELPPPTPPKAFAEVSRGNNKATTNETFITGSTVESVL